MTMTETKSSDGMAAYSEAVKSGLYAKKSGLVGKYDNVRLYWEDEINRIFLRPHLQGLIDRSGSKMRRVRIMDLGCGSADGYELLSGVRKRDPNINEVEVDLLSPDVLGLYKGVDLNPDLARQAVEIYGNEGKMIIEQADFTKGLPLADDEKPYDLYFSSYGTFSHHNDDETAIELLAQIAGRVEDYAVIVCDWLGRYSYEWQSTWTNKPETFQNLDYVVSYIYPEDEREQRRDDLEHLTLRMMSRAEAQRIVEEASKRAGVSIKPLTWYDRSVFTGRHMDTGDYNRHAQPIRLVVNSLHEPNTRTDLSELKIDYSPKPGFEFINDYYERIQMCWNTLVSYVQDLLIDYDEAKRVFRSAKADIPTSYPAPLRATMERMRRVIEGSGWLKIGQPRENIIEPQLGYALRELIMTLQQGQGCGHGLVGIFAVDKHEKQ